MNNRKKAALALTVIASLALCLYLITLSAGDHKKSVTIFRANKLNANSSQQLADTLHEVLHVISSDASRNCSLFMQNAEHVLAMLTNISAMDYINATHHPYYSEDNETCWNTLMWVQHSVEGISAILKSITENETGFNFALDLDTLERKCNESYRDLELLVSLSKGKVSRDAEDVWSECEQHVTKTKAIIAAAFAEFKSRKMHFEQEIIDRCVADIKKDLMFDARESYRKHRGSKTLMKIIRASYQNATLPNIFLFIDNLDSVMEKAQGYQTLVYEMQSHNHLERVILLAIKSAVRYQDSLSKTRPVKERTEVVLILSDIRQRIKHKVDYIIGQVANDIKSSQHDVIVKEFKGVYDDAVLFQGVYPEEYLNHLKAIVSQVTSGSANETNVRKLLSFTHKLYLRQRTQFFIELLKEMEKVDGIPFKTGLALVLEARQVLGLLDYRYALDLTLQTAVKSLMSKYPKGLQALVITTYVCLRNAKSNAFLNVRKPLATDKGKQEYFVVTNHMKGVSWQGVQWQAVSYDAEQVFRIRTKSSNKDVDFLLLHVSLDAGTSEKVVSAGGRGLDAGGTWHLVDADWRADEYYLYNVDYDVYLAEDDVSAGSERNVITKNGQSPRDGNYLSLKIENC